MKNKQTPVESSGMSSADYMSHLYAMSRGGRDIIDVETAMWAHDEIARLQAKLDKLPKTADGVTPINGQALWAIASDGDIVDGPMEGWGHFKGELCFMLGRGPNRDYVAKLCNTYSTLEAAEAAREKKAAGKAG